MNIGERYKDRKNKKGVNKMDSKELKKLIIALLRYFQHSRVIPYKFLLEQEKIIILNNLNKEDSNILRNKEVDRYIELLNRLNETNQNIKIIDEFTIKKMDEIKLIEDYFNLHTLATIIGEDKITKEHKECLVKYRYEIAFRDLGEKVGYTYIHY